jgi:tRNA modification GTPase
MMIFGDWHHPLSGEFIDEGLAVYFAGPNSYTGNDLVEFQCHGGSVPVRQLLEAVLACGARMAEPGEFTRRAYLNGRMDLAQAEGVADLINAQTAAAARLAQRQLAGRLSEQIHMVREGMINLAAELEARIDFPEEDLEQTDRARLAAAFARHREMIDAMLATGRRGRLLREGARIALVGRPNAGKSSLLNALVQAERAIVTPHPGTTRDTVECTLDLGGMPVTLIDTAGLRASEDPIECLGIARAHDELARADLVVLVCDATAPSDAISTTALQREPDVIAWNKIDLVDSVRLTQSCLLPAQAIYPVSAQMGTGLPALEARLIDLLQGADQPVEGQGELAVNLRHAELLTQAGQALEAARASFEANLSGEFSMVDLREALDALGAILGEELGDAILDRVFSRFCIGK